MDRGDQKYYCHVCNMNCHDDEGFRRHMNSNRHKDRMLGVLSIHEEKSSQIASRMKAEKHLRNVEDDDFVRYGNNNKVYLYCACTYINMFALGRLQNE